jgi:hypothetical protein
VHVIQIVDSIAIDRDSLGFHSLGQVRTLQATLVDDQGYPVLDSVLEARIGDSTIASVVGVSPLVVRSTTNGNTLLTLRAGLVRRDVLVEVQQRPTTTLATVKNAILDALGDSVRFSGVAYDSLGVPIAGAPLTYLSSQPGIATVDAGGLVIGHHNGTSQIVIQASGGTPDSGTVIVAQRIVEVVFNRDSLLFEALQAAQQAGARALDRLGSVVDTATLTYRTVDSVIATVAADGVVRAVGNGRTMLTVHAAAESAQVPVRVAQRPVRVLVPADTIRFVALGETQPIVGIAVDSLGFPLRAGVESAVVVNSGVASFVDSVTLRAQSNGFTHVGFRVAGLSAGVGVLVSQVPDTVVAILGDSLPIITAGLGAPLPLTCQVRDRNGFNMTDTATVVASYRPTVTGSLCGALVVARSGLDTLTISAGAAHTHIAYAVALTPSASPTVGIDLPVDSLPTGSGPWAPTARINSRGEYEVYFTAYIFDSVAGRFRGDLHRLRSSDGVSFHYDGVVLQKSEPQCSLNGSGIEDIDIVPRADSSGWRMYYSGGSFTCYGWQVFSAVSTDEDHWTKESGVRLSNGGPLTGSPPTSQSPWPAGEGMVTEQLPSGDWRMLAGTYEHLTPPEVKFQITEWRSVDQINWTYVGPILTTRQLPPEGQRSIYSPTVRAIAPGLWRMVFTADNLNVPGGRSRLWSAVSTDKTHWQVEGELISASGYDFSYSTWLGDQLIFLAQPSGQSRRLARAAISMP